MLPFGPTDLLSWQWFLITAACAMIVFFCFGVAERRRAGCLAGMIGGIAAIAGFLTFAFGVMRLLK
jgi:uncharacterized BrkB/YihY/UPF0761 family membrane protein